MQKTINLNEILSVFDLKRKSRYYKKYTYIFEVGFFCFSEKLD